MPHQGPRGSLALFPPRHTSDLSPADLIFSRYASSPPGGGSDSLVFRFAGDTTRPVCCGPEVDRSGGGPCRPGWIEAGPCFPELLGFSAIGTKWNCGFSPSAGRRACGTTCSVPSVCPASAVACSSKSVHSQEKGIALTPVGGFSPYRNIDCSLDVSSLKPL
jgi:hypothetical protein